MAGVKGRSGGPRPNSGGKRAGAGRKPAPPVFSETSEAQGDAEKFLRNVICDTGNDLRLRLEAAKALLPYQKPKIGEGGKKEQRQEAANKASTGRFAAPAPPKLTLVKSA